MSIDSSQSRTGMHRGSAGAMVDGDRTMRPCARRRRGAAAVDAAATVTRGGGRGGAAGRGRGGGVGRGGESMV